MPVYLDNAKIWNMYSLIIHNYPDILLLIKAIII